MSVGVENASASRAVMLEVRRQQLTESLAEAGRIGIRGEQPDVIANVGERRMFLQFNEHVSEHCWRGLG